MTLISDHLKVGRTSSYLFHGYTQLVSCQSFLIIYNYVDVVLLCVIVESLEMFSSHVEMKTDFGMETCNVVRT